MTTLLFDIDGTLVRTGGAGKAAIEAALAEDFSVALRAEEVPYSGRTDVAISKDLLRAHDLPPTDDHVRRLIAGYLRRLPAALGTFGGRVCPGVPELLAAVAGRADVRLGLLTGNVRRGAEHKLSHYGLWGHFAFGGFGDHHEDRDDVARAALADAERHAGTRLNPDAVWVIGDTPLDVKCARAIGAKVIAVATGWHPLDELRACGADLAVEDLSDTAAVLRLWP